MSTKENTTKFNKDNGQNNNKYLQTRIMKLNYHYHLYFT